jgi:orotate phosphoribosyltransferase
MKEEKMKRKALAKRIYLISNIKGEFKLRSGQISNEYFDKYLFESDFELIKEIAKRAVKMLPKKFDCLGGLEMGGIPIATMISHYSRKKTLFIRKDAKEYGTRKYAEGGDVKGKEIVIIEDVVTSGGAILDAVKKLRNDGAIVKKVICVIDRESGGKEKLKENNLDLKALFTKSELEKYGKKHE